MSATSDAGIFQEFFNGCPLLEVSGASLYMEQSLGISHADNLYRKALMSKSTIYPPVGLFQT